jgi:glutamate dehydrogenase/leucine dehydrogenase
VPPSARRISLTPRVGVGKGGSDFDPKGKSEGEVMRFCQALMTELYRHLGPDTDVPAGDIGVGGREVGFMAGMMKKLSNNSACVFTGKGLSFGGSLIRPEATGYGLVYFTQAMLQRHGMSFEGMRVSVSGSGNVAQYAIEKAMELGARVITASDSSGTVVDEAGFTTEKLARLCEIKASRDGRVADYAREFGLTYMEGKQPWAVPVDIALPCATQNELDIDAARQLVANGVKAVAEGANMPTTIEATDLFLEAGVLFAPGKAANAGGVATSGLEMAQNAARMGWKAEKVDAHRVAVIHAEQDRGGNVGGQQGLQQFLFLFKTMLRLCQHDLVSRGLQHLLQAGEHFGTARLGEVRHHHGNGPGGGRCQGAGRQVGHVAQLVNGGVDLFAQFIGNLFRGAQRTPN